MKENRLLAGAVPNKVNYKYLCEEEDYITEDTEKGKIKVVYCYDIAPDYRGKGIASLMLKKICEDAKKEGFQYVYYEKEVVLIGS